MGDWVERGCLRGDALGDWKHYWVGMSHTAHATQTSPPRDINIHIGILGPAGATPRNISQVPMHLSIICLLL